MPHGRPGEQAMTAVIAGLLMVAISAALAAYVAVQDPANLRRHLESRSNSPPPDTGFFAQHERDYKVRPIGPDNVPLATSTLIIVADGIRYSLPATVLAPQLPAGATSWTVGQTVCVSGTSPSCLLPAAKAVAFSVRSNGSTIVDIPALPG